MSAIITEKFRKNNANAFLNDIADLANNYYIGLGKAKAWPDIAGDTEDDPNYSVAAPIGTFGDTQQVLNNLTTLVGFESTTCSLVIPNNPAKVTYRYKAYTPYDPTCFYQTVVESVVWYPCYTVVNNNVYLCLKTATTSAPYSVPNGTGTTRAKFTLADNSVWIYVYSVESSFPVNNNQFVSVPSAPTPTETPGSAEAIQALVDIEAGSGNLVYGFTVIDGGTGYTSNPTVEFVGDDNSVTALAVTRSGTTLSKVEYVGLPNTWTMLQKQGYVRISGGAGSGAVVYPNIAPAAGFGAVPSNDLPAWYAGIAISAVEDIFADGAYIPYRQVSIVKNPDYTGGTVSPELSLKCNSRLEFTVAPGFTGTVVGDIVTQDSSGAIGIVDYYDSANKYLYYTQTFETGFVPFVISAPVSIGVDDGIPTVVTSSEYTKGTGEVIFTENRKKISRVGGQTEEITIILQF